MARGPDIDPLTIALSPPSDETEEQRLQRLAREEEARIRSEKIDEQLKEEKAAMKKKKKPIKVLLLGQSESGKSTTLKNFQLTYARKAWIAERAAWRTVIQLNLLRNVNTILDTLDQGMALNGISGSDSADSDLESDLTPAASTIQQNRLRFTEKHRLLKYRLLPLRSVQSDLQARLGASDSQEGDMEKSGRTRGDFFVRSNTGWKSALQSGRLSGEGQRSDKASSRRKSDENESADVLAGCAEDIKSLWADEVIQDMLLSRRIRLDIMPGFFLGEGDVDRIARRDYMPSDHDVVRARLRTLGVQEHRILFETGPASGTEWLIYDVGGSRTQRAAWFPYFDDCNAIIFLAPISCFDEKLAEDRHVNRLEDSFALWKMIYSSKLLSKAQIILFLNKCDILEKKLLSGVRVRDYVPSYGDRSNTLPAVAQYFAHHFRDIAKNHISEVRPFRVHLTSVVDTQATGLTLGIVGESILRTQLRDADLL